MNNRKKSYLLLLDEIVRMWPWPVRVSSEGPTLGSHVRRGQDPQSPNTSHMHNYLDSASSQGSGPGHSCCHMSPSLLTRVRGRSSKGFPDQPPASLARHCSLPRSQEGRGGWSARGNFSLRRSGPFQGSSTLCPGLGLRPAASTSVWV